MFSNQRLSRLLTIWLSCAATWSNAGDSAQLESTSLDELPLAQVRCIGSERSRYRSPRQEEESSEKDAHASNGLPPQPNLAAFETTVGPLLERHCQDCHGPYESEGNVRVDTLDPNLLQGSDTDWWSEVFSVVAKGEMPPADASDLADQERQQIIDWLAAELQKASVARRASADHSTFRRLTRYELNYALQDLLGLPWNFTEELPPEAHSEDGFQNSSHHLHLSVSQFETLHRIARSALNHAAVTGDPPPTRYWDISMRSAGAREWSKQDDAMAKLEKKLKDDPEKLTQERERLQASFGKTPRGAFFHDLANDRVASADWNYRRAQYAFSPVNVPFPEPSQESCVAVLPHGMGARLIFELGNQLPTEGTMRVTVGTSRVETEGAGIPSLQLFFGWQASNEGRALIRVSEQDTEVTAGPGETQIIQWDVPLSEIYPRNAVRTTGTMGQTPSPSEYIRIVNSSASPAPAEIHWVQVAAPVHDQWPPPSHRRIFGPGRKADDEAQRAQEVIADFMSLAWRRPITDEEVGRKLDLFRSMRPSCESFEEAVVEVLATVLSSPQFLFVSNRTLESDDVGGDTHHRLNQHALASRLALFLWCSVPDQELLRLAHAGQLADDSVLMTQIQRMLTDAKSGRFAKHFVHQWLDMQLLDFQDFKRHVPGFDPLLKEAMQHEPVELFEALFRNDASVLDFLHSDYAMVNERLARHYGLAGVVGNQFRQVPLGAGVRRGGLLTQAGLIAMNSDYPDSHPLKRAVWLLESVLGDPPPPPPPAVPQIDLADPRIAEMTLKERIEDHRNHAACMSCHVKIDPWGIAFENYDALGRWRDKIAGKPVDASSELFNHERLDGMDGLKRFLLLHRQDQFVRALVSKLVTYALGRPLAFSDQAEVDAITTVVRQRGDGLRSTLEAIVLSELFQCR
ncbi:MAG: DUF1592 domain-containing protein [Planctomycetota bacterium]